jgi:hypothetical protein
VAAGGRKRPVKPGGGSARLRVSRGAPGADGIAVPRVQRCPGDLLRLACPKDRTGRDDSHPVGRKLYRIVLATTPVPAKPMDTITGLGRPGTLTRRTRTE